MKLETKYVGAAFGRINKKIFADDNIEWILCASIRSSFLNKVKDCGI